jgi:hypothetical protein
LKGGCQQDHIKSSATIKGTFMNPLVIFLPNTMEVKKQNEELDQNAFRIERALPE